MYAGLGLVDGGIDRWHGISRSSPDCFDSFGLGLAVYRLFWMGYLRKQKGFYSFADMLTNWYNPTHDEMIYGQLAVKHKITKELCLFGKYGQIWFDTEH